MPKQPISTYRSHPAYDTFIDYAFDAPDGTWIGRLDHVAYGKTHNLLCFFTDDATGKKYRLSTFWSNKFRPYSEGPSFNEEVPGGRYEIRTVISKNSLPKFDYARLLKPSE